MAEIAMSESHPVELRARMFMELAHYVYPKRKAVDVRVAEPEPRAQATSDDGHSVVGREGRARTSQLGQGTRQEADGASRKDSAADTARFEWCGRSYKRPRCRAYARRNSQSRVNRQAELVDGGVGSALPLVRLALFRPAIRSETGCLAKDSQP